MSVKLHVRQAGWIFQPCCEGYDVDGLPVLDWAIDGAVGPHLSFHSNQIDDGHRYYIFAGMVFTPLTGFYLRHQYGAAWCSKAPLKLCEAHNHNMEAAGQEVVVLSKVCGLRGAAAARAGGALGAAGQRVLMHVELVIESQGPM
jgi:hypothetical protein